MNRTLKSYGLGILLAEAVGALSAFLTRSGMKRYMELAQKPPLSPPPWVFPIVWGVLYALMGIGAARVYLSPPSPARSWGLNRFVMQLGVNFLWSLIFFGVQAFGIAFFWLLLLWGLSLSMLLLFWKADPLAGKLQIPYLIWLTFAAYLNYGVWQRNG